jgi:hypothetical protein
MDVGSGEEYGGGVGRAQVGKRGRDSSSEEVMGMLDDASE